MASDVSYRIVRNDFHTHPKTAGLSPFARDLFMQCLSANLVGAMQRSEKQMARVGNMRESDVRRGVNELVQRGICHWFAEDEILWLVECADEQIKSPTAWKSAKAVIGTLAQSFQEAFRIRYGANPAIGYPIGYQVPYPAVSSASQSVQEAGSRKQEAGESLALVPLPTFGFVEARAAVNEAREEAGLSHVVSLSRREETDLMSYAETCVKVHPDPFAHAKAAHAAWLRTADAKGDYGRKRPMSAWMTSPDAALFAEMAKRARATEATHAEIDYAEGF